jgi:hypothetical protein
MRYLAGAFIAAFVSAGAAPAWASDARIELTAHVPASCSMSFTQDVARLSDGTFTLGSVEQFCNTNYELTLLHAPVGSGKQFRFGDRSVNAGPGMTVLQPNGRPVIGSRLLLISGLDEAAAEALGHSLVLQVTPLAL